MPSTLVTTQAGRLLSSKGGRGRRIRGAARCGEAPSRLKVSLAEGGAGVSFRQQFFEPPIENARKVETRNVSSELLAQLPRHNLKARRAVGNIDLLRSMGPNYAWNHFAAKRRRTRLGDHNRDRVYRAIWDEAAQHIKAKVVDLGSGILEIHREGVRTRVWQQFVDLDDSVTLRVAHDKPLSLRLLAAGGLPTPAGLEYDRRNFGRAVEFLEESNLPCVVKPARGTGGGAGIVCGVTNVRDLTRATLWASRTTPDLLIERQAVGQVYRFLFLHGKLLDVIHTGPATVTGDGRSTIYQLIAAENQRRSEAGGREGLTILSVDRDCLVTLERTERTLKTIPGPQESVIVKSATNDSCVEDNQTVSQAVSSALVEQVAKAASAIGVKVAGVDVITTDVGQSLHDTNGVVIEVNGGPALHRHYHVRDASRAQHVAIPILESLLAS